MDKVPVFSYTQYSPDSDLSDVIECYWYFKGESKRNKDLQTLIPGGRLEWIISLENPLQWLIAENQPGILPKESFILGQRDRHFYAKPQGNAELWGVRFRPGGIGAFSEIPVFKLLNSVAEAKEILPTGIASLEKGLRSASGAERIVDLMNSELLKFRRYRGINMDQSIELINQFRIFSESNNIFEICQHSSIHYKKLERVFQKFVGYSPKTYLRILRFNRMLKKLSAQSHPLTELAYSEGFFDQSHFIREFWILAGTSPGKFEINSNQISSHLIKYQPV